MLTSHGLFLVRLVFLFFFVCGPLDTVFFLDLIWEDFSGNFFLFFSKIDERHVKLMDIHIYTHVFWFSDFVDVVAKIHLHYRYLNLNHLSIQTLISPDISVHIPVFFVKMIHALFLDDPLVIHSWMALFHWSSHSFGASLTREGQSSMFQMNWSLVNRDDSFCDSGWIFSTNGFDGHRSRWWRKRMKWQMMNQSLSF